MDYNYILEQPLVHSQDVSPSFYWREPRCDRDPYNPLTSECEGKLEQQAGQFSNIRWQSKTEKTSLAVF